MRKLENLKKGNSANSVLVEANFRDTHLAKTQFQNYNLEESALGCLSS